jgi:hypothetical protein
MFAGEITIDRVMVVKKIASEDTNRMASSTQTDILSYKS